MKIEKIETWLVSKWLTVRVTCDDGTYGVGEGNFWSFADATEVIAHRVIEDIRGMVESSLGAPIEEIYDSFDEGETGSGRGRSINT